MVTTGALSVEFNVKTFVPSLFSAKESFSFEKKSGSQSYFHELSFLFSTMYIVNNSKTKN